MRRILITFIATVGVLSLAGCGHPPDPTQTAINDTKNILTQFEPGKYNKNFPTADKAKQGFAQYTLNVIKPYTDSSYFKNMEGDWQSGNEIDAFLTSATNFYDTLAQSIDLKTTLNPSYLSKLKAQNVNWDGQQVIVIEPGDRALHLYFEKESDGTVKIVQITE